MMALTEKNDTYSTRISALTPTGAAQLFREAHARFSFFFFCFFCCSSLFFFVFFVVVVVVVVVVE